MSELSLKNPWVFTAVNVAVWALVWGGVQLLLFGGGGAYSAAVEAGLAAVVFSALYLYLGRSEPQKNP